MMKPYRFRVTFSDGVSVPVTGYATNADALLIANYGKGIE